MVPDAASTTVRSAGSDSIEVPSLLVRASVTRHVPAGGLGNVKSGSGPVKVRGVPPASGTSVIRYSVIGDWGCDYGRVM